MYMKAYPRKTHADTKVLRSLLKKHFHSQMKKQKIGELRVSCVDGGRSGKGVMVTEKYEKPWSKMGETRESSCFSQRKLP